MEAAIGCPPVTREKLDRLTVKRTAKFEDQGYSVDHRATFPKTPSAARCADLIGDEFARSGASDIEEARGALAHYEDIRKDRTRAETTREQDASVQPGIGE